MLTPVDMKRFMGFLDGDLLRAKMVDIRNYREGDLYSKGSNFDNQMIREYCRRYDCFDQYEDWVAFIEYGRRMRE